MVVGDIILAIASGSSIAYYESVGEDHINWRCGAFGLCLAHGLVGVINYFAERDELEKVYTFTGSCVDIIPLPFVATQLYLDNSMDNTIAYIHAASGVVPIVMDLLDSDTASVRDLVIIANFASVTFLAVQQDKPWYIGIGIVGALNHFCTKKAGERWEIPPTETLAVGVAIFCLLAAIKS